MRAHVIGVAVLAFVGATAAEDQVWNDGGADNEWSTNAANWAGGTVWTNGNSAVFSGSGGTAFGEAVDISATVTVATVTFQTNGYEIADADGDGLFLIAGLPSTFSVVNAGDTGTISVAVSGSGGITKSGSGVLSLTTNNVYAGLTTVSAGILRLARSNLMALGTTGTGNDTVVSNGATLDFNGCYVDSSTSEKFTVEGTGFDGKGVLINTGSGHVNKNLGEVILQESSMIGGPNRIDVLKLTGNGKTLTKAGAHQLCMREVVNTEIVINEGNYTLLSDWRGLGGNTAGDTTVNGGTLYGYGTMSVPEQIVFNGGTLSEGGGGANTLTLTGHITLKNRIAVSPGNSTMVIEMSGLVDGGGGFAQGSSGVFILSGNTNTYSGSTVINGGNFWVGRPGTDNGAWGAGGLTNSGNVYFYSGRFGSGEIVNLGSLYFDRPGAYTMTNCVSGTGTARVRYTSEPVFRGNLLSNGYLRVVDGVLTLTNGAGIVTTGDFTLSDPQSGSYTNAVIDFPVTSVVNITEGTWVNVRDLIIGNPASGVGYNQMLVGTVNQTGGDVCTYGCTAESNGIRVAHYPLALGTYNMMGGRLTVDNGWDLCIATDGTGWVHQTGGEIYASRVMLHERNDNVRGFGRLTVEGGVLNIGLTNGIQNVVGNGIAVDGSAAYLVEYGGAGGTVRAGTNFTSSLNATLFGSNENAITFDTTNWTITLSGKLTGTGGLNKRGSGDLVLSGTNTYAGPTRIMEGGIVRGASDALPAGGKVLFGVTPDDAGGKLVSDGDLSLSGIVVGVANPEALDEHAVYTIATYGGTLVGLAEADCLPKPWYVYYDVTNKRVQLKAAVGTVISLR